MLSSFLNGTDWTKQFITKILQITHSQWIYRNILLHNKRQGYLHHKRADELTKEMEVLADLSPEDVPEASRFLLEINFTELSQLHVETQKYWILAVNAALTAQNRELARGAREKWARGRTNTRIPSRRKLGLVAIEQQIRKDGMHRPPTSNDPSTHHTQTTVVPYARKRPHPATAVCLLKSNKRMQKPDWTYSNWVSCVRGYTLSLLLAFCQDYFPNDLMPKGLGTHWVPNPVALCDLAVVRHGNQKDFRLSHMYIEQ